MKPHKLALCASLTLCVVIGIAGCASPGDQSAMTQLSSSNRSKENSINPQTPTVSTPAQKVAPRTWEVGKFTVKELLLPSDFFKEGNREIVVGTTLLTLGARTPYPVTWRSLTSDKTGTVLSAGCPVQTSFAYFDKSGTYPQDSAGLICVGFQKSTLSIIHVSDMTAKTFPFPARSKTNSEYAVNALAFGGPSDPHLLWYVQQSEGPAPLLGSGVLDLKTGQNEPIPNSMNADLHVSPNGTLYAVHSDILSKWTGKAFEPLGKLPNLRVEAVGNDGIVWASAIPPSNAPYSFEIALVRETPGSTKTQSWQVDGGSNVFGPGFVAWTPDGISGEVKILFPEVHRTLTFPEASGQPLLYGKFGSPNYQIITNTKQGPVVIEIVPAS